MSVIIFAMSGKKRLHYDGRKFTSKGRPKVFASPERAAAKQTELLKRFTVLRHYSIGVARYVPPKKVRKNPRSGTRNWRVTFKDGTVSKVKAASWKSAQSHARLANHSGIVSIVLIEAKPEARRRQAVKAYQALRKNPSSRALNAADDLLESFSGSRATKEIRHRVRPIRVGLAVGQMTGVMYAADRGDGVHEYCHRFKPGSRPLLIADHDGTQLGIVGGRYQFTERGIVDK